MMRRQPDAQQKLFYTCLNLEKRIRKDHILRKITAVIDFISFTSKSKINTASMAMTIRGRQIISF